MAREPIRVSIVGGGCAAVTAAFELTRQEHRGRYRVTVYQMGWRLGGKGASGRGPSDRIEEHGLHLWMGYYENAFRLLRECYAELDRDPRSCRIADWRDAFFADPVVGLADPAADGNWHSWLAYFPPQGGLPGDPRPAGEPPSIGGYLVRAATLLRTVLDSARGSDPGDGTASAGEAAAGGSGSSRSPVAAAPAEALELAEALLRYARLATLGGLIEATRLLETICDAWPAIPVRRASAWIEALASSARRVFEALIASDREMCRIWSLVDLILTLVRGVIRCRLATDPRGLDAIDGDDFRDWLRRHGASRMTVESAFVRGLYSLAFAFEDGDSDRPRLAAGVAVRGLLRMFFTYRGALFWKMRASMGDVVFAPFYEVLKRRGVRFRFFHRLENVGLGTTAVDGRPYVESLELDVQAELRNGGDYRPLVDVRGLPCWPARPLYGQLADGDGLEREGRDLESPWEAAAAGRRTLRVGRDFDFVVLAVGLGAIPRVGRELLAADRRWREMIRSVKTVATQAFQLWLREPLENLGWSQRSVNYTGFVTPFDTWADMSHLIAEERWNRAPRALAYFCNTLPAALPEEEGEIAFERDQRDRVRRNAIHFLRYDLPHLWPGAGSPEDGFRWSLLAADASAHGDGETDGASRFETQFWCANVRPSDRYVLALPGSTRYRLSPLDNTFDNLTIAGDWTACGLNYGCVEAAVMSGRLAAHALSGLPRLEDIVGYDHP